MGACDVVPGVSGGTMAFILGIYEELIESVRMIGDPAFVKTALQLRLREALSLLNWKFLLSVGAGVGIAVLSLAHALEWLLVNHPVFLWSFFFGLVLASVFVVGQRVADWGPSRVLALLIAAGAAFSIVGLVPAQTPESWWFLFLSGALAICAMILPGVSGAFILLLLGKYQFVLSAVTQRDVVSLTIVAAGAAIGLVTFAQILSWLFRRYHDLTVAMLTGLMLGSLRKVWPWKEDVSWLRDGNGDFLLDSAGQRIAAAQIEIPPPLTTGAEMTEFTIAVTLALAGLLAILLLDRLAGHQM
jgi:putative membrane protein